MSASSAGVEAMASGPSAASISWLMAPHVTATAAMPAARADRRSLAASPT